METQAKQGSFKPVVFVMLASMVIAFFWDKILIIKNTAHTILNPTAGFLLNMNLTYGMLFIIFAISLIMTLLQKYATDQETIRELKAEQKQLQKDMKEFKEHPEKLIEMQKNAFPLTIELMKHSMRPMMFTGVPLILFFRWFMDYFSAPALEGFKFLGFLGWFWFYFICSMIFSMILRKVLKVV